MRGIFFDAADVFYDRLESTTTVAQRLLKEHGYSGQLSAEDQARQQALHRQATGGFIAPTVYWDEALKLYGVGAARERAPLVARIMAHADDTRAIPGGRETMAELKRRGFVLGIITDTIYPLEQKMRWLAKVGVAQFIDVVTCSSALGMHKPDPGIYLDGIKKANLTVGESCFVGHDAGELAGARRVGMTTVAVLYDLQAQADYYAKTLPDLLDVPVFQRQHTQRVETMNHDIEAIFLDVGNTLRIVVKDAPFQAQARQQMVALVGAQEGPEAFCERLEGRYKTYRKWAFENLSEASERELWTRWMLPDFPSSKIAPLSGRLTRLWRDRDGRRVARPDVKSVVVELSRRGYVLGIIANTITETEIPDWLEADGLAHYFKTVVLSSKVGLRKPGPEIYWEAARRAGVAPARSVYVGDNPARDVVGTRRAGFAMIIILMEPAKLAEEPPTGEKIPDRIIHTCSELLDMFPPR